MLISPMGCHILDAQIATIRGFYAHSNWVEPGNTARNADRIRNWPMDPYTASLVADPQPLRRPERHLRWLRLQG